MSKIFKHFLITRFNVVDWAGYEVSYDYVNSDVYLSNRFQLFERYCFSSVRKQHNTNFTWLILFNDQLPEKWRLEIEKYQKKLSNIEIRYLPSILEGEWQRTLNNLIITETERLDYKPHYVLTTRIDNDDAVNFSFIDGIQKYFIQNKEEAIINYINGLQYIPQHNVLKHFTSKDSHFSTMVEENTKNMQTVFAFPHTSLPVDFKAVYLKEKKRMWLEVIHSTNVLNVYFFQPRNLLKDLFFVGFEYKNLADFGIEHCVPRFNFATWKLFFLWISKKINSIFANR